MNKKYIASAILVILAALTIGIISNKNHRTEQFRIGVIVPLSGDYAAFGEKIRNGMEIAREELSAKGSQVEIIYEDACLPKDAVSAATKLITIDKVDLIGASFCLIGLIPSIPTLEQNQIIAFNTAANPDTILNNPNIFSTNFSIKDDAKKIGTYLAGALKAKKIALVYYDNDFGKSYQVHIREAVTANGSSVVFEQSTQHDEKDFRTVLSRLKQANPDGIALVEIGPSLGVFLKQAKEFNITIPIVGYYENEDPSLAATIGSAAEGFIVSSADPVNKNQQLDEFIQKYSAKYHVEPDTLALNAYDALHIQISGLEKCSNDFGCLQSYFKSVKNYQGLSGDITIQEDGSASKPSVFKMVKGGKFVKID